MSSFIFNSPTGAIVVPATRWAGYNLRMSSDPRQAAIEAAIVTDGVAEHEALNGVPLWLDIPDELSQTIEKQVLLKERMFWLRSTAIVKDAVSTTLLRRAIYAEQRCWEMENRAAEMALITFGAANKVKELEKKLTELAKATY